MHHSSGLYPADLQDLENQIQVTRIWIPSVPAVSNFFCHADIDDHNSSVLTAVQVLPVVGQSSDYDDDQTTAVPPMDSNKLASQFRSFSLSPVSADISEPETETEEDQESRPYLRKEPHKEKKRPRPLSTPIESNNSPSHVIGFFLLA
jgi:hypothetical protein